MFTSSSMDRYQAHLDRVSRSFAFCIRQLPQPLNEWVGLSYLLCRVADTVEDAPWVSVDLQAENFARFDRALLRPADVGAVADWVTSFPRGLSEGECLLLADAPTLMTDYHSCPPPVRDAMRDLIFAMSQGMQHFCRTRAGGELRLRTLGEVNQYCFFVAGVVGELLAKLVAIVEPAFQVTDQILLRAHHFGLFLQKVNLLKDQVGDERAGRHFIPSRERVEASAGQDAVQALEFIMLVPASQIEFRRFCAWSLFLGLESVGAARASLSESRVLKVTRRKMEEIFAAIESRLMDNNRLRELFEKSIRSLGWSLTGTPAVSSGGGIPVWMTEIYGERGLLKVPGSFSG